MGFQWAHFGNGKKKGVREFFTIPEIELSASDLISENLTLKAKLAQLTAKQELILNTIRIFGFQIQYK